MTSKLKFDLIRPPYFGGAWDFQIYKIFCLSTPWTLNLQFKSFWVVFSERVCHTKEFFRSGFLEFDFLPKLLVRVWATRSSRGWTKKSPPQQQLGVPLDLSAKTTLLKTIFLCRCSRRRFVSSSTHPELRKQGSSQSEADDKRSSAEEEHRESSFQLGRSVATLGQKSDGGTIRFWIPVPSERTQEKNRSFWFELSPATLKIWTWGRR